MREEILVSFGLINLEKLLSLKFAERNNMDMKIFRSELPIWEKIEKERT